MTAKKSDLFPAGAHVSQHMAALRQHEEGCGSAVYSRPRGNPLSTHSYFIVCCCECKTIPACPCPVVGHPWAAVPQECP